MKRRAWWILGAVIVIAGVVLGVVLHNRSDRTTTTMSGMSMHSSANTSASDATPTVATNTVTINDFSFGPQNITIQAGTTVTWKNQDSVSHTVTAKVASPNAPNSQEIMPGSSFSFVFPTPGTYAYRCIIHPSMQGTVVVTK